MVKFHSTLATLQKRILIKAAGCVSCKSTLNDKPLHLADILTSSIHFHIQTRQKVPKTPEQSAIFD